jgi:uncharacterized membrane protein YeaQ/YmgE (transglycosylase-associated protein family)
MDIVNLIISLVCGALGGNVAGAVLKDKSLGTLGNSLSGILGGGIGGAILQALGLLGSSGGLSLASILGDLVSGGLGGGILMAIVAFIRGAYMKKI